MLTCINAFRSVAAFLFPIFASYKALKANDQTQLTPWLMYWVVVACVIVVENFLGWFLNLIPMYQDIKAVFLLWLVLPQTQGATYLYLTYIHPYIQAHESDIENIISSGHDQFKRIGITYLRRFWAYLQQTLGLPTQAHARPLTPPQRQPNQAPTYTQLLLQKFSLPPIGPFDPAYNFIMSLFAPAAPVAAGEKDMSASSLSNFQLPDLPHEHKAAYIESQRHKLLEYIKFLDDAASQHHTDEADPQDPVPESSRRKSVPGGFNSGSAPLAEDGYEAVSSDDLPSAVASGVKLAEEATQRGWFGWGYRTWAGSAPQSPQ